jgi:hypothetical protein
MLHHETREANRKSLMTEMPKPVPAIVLLNLAFRPGFLPARAQAVEIRPVVLEKDGGQCVEYWSGNLRVGRSTEATPAGVQLRLRGMEWAPVRFQERTERDGAVELGLGVTDQAIAKTIAAYRSLFNTKRGFMPTSRPLKC